MDYKAVKQSVCVNETVFSKSAEVPFDFDFTLPDYCPDIVKILKCRVSPRIASKGINGADVNVDGHICVNVIYCDEKGCIYSYEQISPFSKSFECEEEIPSGFVMATVKNEYANCRAVTERRVDIHGAVTVNANVLIRKNHDVICEIEQGDIQIKRKNINSMTSMGVAEKSLIIEEEVKASGEADSIDAVLQYDATPVIAEIKAMKNKVVVKGNLAVTVMYCTKGHTKYHTLKTMIPFSQFLDMDEVNEECRLEAKAELSFFEARLKKGDEECKTLLINAKICVLAKAFCDLEVPVICDAFSLKENIDIQKDEVCLERLLDTVNDTYMLKTVFDFPKDSLFDIINYRADVNVKACNLKNGKIILDAMLTLSLICLDNQKKTLYFEKNCDFVWERPYNAEDMNDICCDARLDCVSSSYTILSDSSLEYRSEFKVCVAVSQKSKTPLIVTIDTSKEGAKKKQRNCCTVIYYPEDNESVWEIAKRYNSDVNELKKINEIASENVNSQKALIIPIY